MSVVEMSEEEKKKEARKTSINEGSFSAFSSGIADNYIIAFAQELLATPFQIGILNAFFGLLSPLAQFRGSRLIEKQSRKEIVVRYVFLQSLMWIPIALLGILFFLGIWQGSLPYFLILFYGLYAFFAGTAAAPWFSWMGDIVPEKEKGKYFSKRNRITGTLGLVGFLLAAVFLDYLKTGGYVLIGFTTLFSFAFILRGIFAFRLFKKQHDPGIKLEKHKYYFSFWQFIRRQGNYTKFAFFMGFFHLGMSVAGPFFIVYMLQELKFSYVTYTIISLSATVFYLILVPLAGKFSDKYGNKKLIYLACVLFSVYPLFWIFLDKPILLIVFPQLIAGIATAAFAIGTTNFIYDTVTPHRRALCVSYMNILVGIGVFLGSLLGGFLLSLNVFPIKGFFLVFIVSSVLRAGFALGFALRFKEIKEFEKSPSVIHYALHPFRLIQSQFVWVKDFSKKIGF